MPRYKCFFRTPVAAVLVALWMFAPSFSADPISLDNRLELFVDDYLIGDIQGDVHQQMLRPEPKEVWFKKAMSAPVASRTVSTAQNAASRTVISSGTTPTTAVSSAPRYRARTDSIVCFIEGSPSLISDVLIS